MTSTVSASTPLTRVLVGFFQPGEIEAYVQTTMQIDTRAIDAAKFSVDYGAARSHVAGLGSRSEPTVTSLGGHAHLNALQAEPTFEEFVSPGGPIELVKIDVRNLVVVQPRVEWSHVEQLAAMAPEPGDTEGLLKFCVPLQRDAPPALIEPSFARTTQTLSFVTDNADFRVCGPVVDSAGNGRAALGFSIGPGLQQMSVMNFEGRYLLNNGHHRAVALAARGHAFALVLLLHGTQVEHTPALRPGRFPPSLVFGNVPPRIEDFLGPAAIDLPRRRTRTLYSFQAASHSIVD